MAGYYKSDRKLIGKVDWGQGSPGQNLQEFNPFSRLHFRVFISPVTFEKVQVVGSS
jgi:hypothetical protein